MTSDFESEHSTYTIKNNKIVTCRAVNVEMDRESKLILKRHKRVDL